MLLLLLNNFIVTETEKKINFKTEKINIRFLLKLFIFSSKLLFSKALISKHLETTILWRFMMLYDALWRLITLYNALWRIIRCYLILPACFFKSSDKSYGLLSLYCQLKKHWSDRTFHAKKIEVIWAKVSWSKFQHF